jgi:hypothetical protein
VRKILVVRKHVGRNRRQAKHHYLHVCKLHEKARAEIAGGAVVANFIVWFNRLKQKAYS